MKTSPVPLQEFDSRQKAAQKEMQRRSLDLLILTLPDSIHYLTGYQTEGLVADLFLAVPANGRPLMVSRNIDYGNLLAEVDPSLIADLAFYADDAGAADSITLLLGLLKKHGINSNRVGLELGSVYLTVVHYKRLTDALAPAELVDIGDMLDAMRWIKSESELDLHRAAGRAAVKSMQAAIEAIRPGVTDGEVASAAMDGMIRGGGEWIANWPHIRTGSHSGLAHRTWQHVEIERGQPTILELCGVVRRYHSPIYRTIIFDPTAEQRAVAASAREANQAGKAALRAGLTTGAVFAEVEKVLKKRGHADLLGCRNGYMVGIGFQPNWVQRGGVSFVRNGDVVLRAGMVFHFLTLLLKHNTFGIGESSTMAITETGAEDMTPGVEPGPFLHS